MDGLPVPPWRRSPNMLLFLWFLLVFRPENVSAATSNHNERFLRVSVVLRGATVVQTRRILPAAVPENLTPEFAVNLINPSILLRSFKRVRSFKNVGDLVRSVFTISNEANIGP